MTQRACRVFISHSANAVEEPATQAFLDALVAAIAAEPGFEPLTDRTDLQAGDDWMQQLYTWMGLCDAAVVLLSPRAVTRENSAWVPRETNLLLWRKSLDKRFVVIPVLLGGLQADALKNNPFLADVRLRDLQFADAQADADKIPLIVQALRDKLAAQCTRLAFDPVRVHVEDCLQRFAPPASVEQALLQHFGADPWQPLVPPAQKLSLQLLRGAASETVDAAIQSVTLGSQGEARLGARLFESLYPLRLPAEPACRLLTLCHEQRGQGSVLVNAHDPWALGMLLRAATGLPRDDLLRTWQIVELPDGWGDDDVGEVTRVLAVELAERMLGTGAWDSLSDQSDPELRLQEQLAVLREELDAACEDRGAPIVVAAAFRPRWLELAAALAARFPTTVFVLWTGDALPPIAATAAAPSTALEPAWPAGRDRAWWRSYRRKITQFGGPPT
ncbi:MAG: toll/interleukin-1 receptor domain-containing protein [Piscinibacter sp.]